MRGFTFIELVVTVTLILIMSSLVIAGYNGFNSAQAVVQGAQTLKTNFVRTRTMATSGDKPENCTELVGHKISFSSETTYNSVAVCLEDGSNTEVGTRMRYTLPKTVTFSTPLPLSFIFYVLGRGASREQVITLTGKGTTKSVNVWVSKAGIVSDYIAPTPTPTP